MSTLGWIILAIIVVVVVVALVLIARSLRGRKLHQRASQASELRQAAHHKAPDIAESRQQLGEAETQAAAARMQAEKAEREAHAARDALAHDEAHQENLLREADRVDPAVDHRADDYRPTAPSTGGAHAAPVENGETVENGENGQSVARRGPDEYGGSGQPIDESTTATAAEPGTESGGTHVSRT